MTGLRLEFRVTPGAITEALAAERGELGRRLRKGIETAGRQTLLDPLRDDTRAAFRSRKLPTTWRIKVYPEDATRASLSPAAFIYSLAPEIITTFEEGATIVPAGGRRFLWVPTENAPVGPGGKRIRPPEIKRQFGGFRLAPTKRGGFVALVKANRYAKGRRRGRIKPPTEKERAAGQQGDEVAVFVLIPRVTLRKRLNVRAIVARASGPAAGHIEAALQEGR
jgi:hypothetical protein